MRPVTKFEPGASIRLMDGTEHIIKQQYKPYQSAKPALTANLGMYCSYCECYVQGIRDLEVEHVQYKSGHPDGEFEWNNFLLSCSTCNQLDNKGTKDVVISNYHLPHLNNTFMSVEYMAGGVVRVNPRLSGLSREKAENLVSLVGLDKSPKMSRPTDNRWLVRSQVWDLAQKQLQKYKDGRIDVDTVIDLAKGYGHWSIWFTVFEGCDEVLSELLKFPGTAQECFDKSNHCCPVPRNPHNSDDTV